MKSAFLIACIVACTYAAPASDDKPVPQIISSENVVEHDGKFHYR